MGEDEGEISNRVRRLVDWVPYEVSVGTLTLTEPACRYAALTRNQIGWWTGSLIDHTPARGWANVRREFHEVPNKPNGVLHSHTGGVSARQDDDQGAERGGLPS